MQRFSYVIFCCIDLLESLFCFVLPQSFVLLGILKVFFHISFAHLLHLLGWDYFWLFFFVALTQSIVMASFASQLVPSYFVVIFISQNFLLTTSYILFYNYFYITIYYAYGSFYLALQLLLYHDLSCLWFLLHHCSYLWLDCVMVILIYLPFFFPRIVPMVYFFVKFLCLFILFLDFYFFPSSKCLHIACNSKIQLIFSNIIKYFFLF